MTNDPKWQAAADREKQLLYTERSAREVGDAGLLGPRERPSTRGFSSAFEHPFGDSPARRGAGRGSGDDDP
jgi:hypothetical protein